MYDVAIIGLGPAGATLARLLDKGIKVIAIDKKNPHGDGGFHKPCGGLLATDAQKSLSKFGLTLPLSVLVDPQIFSVRTIDVGTGLVRHYQRFYINLDRHRLDQWLRSLVPSYVTVEDEAVCTGIQKVADGYEISYIDARKERRIVRARLVVGADGAASRVRRAVYPNAEIRTYMSIQQWFPDRHAAPFYSCIFDPEATDCYAWGLSKEDSFIFGGAFPLHGGREKFETLKGKLQKYGVRLDQPHKTEACLVLRPRGPGDFYCGEKGVFLVGEAAGFISPSSLEGLSYAFDSALALSAVLNAGAKTSPPGDLAWAYHRGVRGIRWKLTGKNLKSPFMYNPFLRKLVMSSGLSSIGVQQMNHEE